MKKIIRAENAAEIARRYEKTKGDRKSIKDLRMVNRKIRKACRRGMRSITVSVYDANRIALILRVFGYTMSLEKGDLNIYW